jgi:hypothetical protein
MKSMKTLRRSEYISYVREAMFISINGYVISENKPTNEHNTRASHDTMVKRRIKLKTQYQYTHGEC